MNWYHMDAVEKAVAVREAVAVMVEALTDARLADCLQTSEVNAARDALRYALIHAEENAAAAGREDAE